METSTILEYPGGVEQSLAALWPLAEPPAEVSVGQRSPSVDPLASDAVWVRRVREGDEEAAGALVERLYPLVVKCVRSHLPRRTTEEDLVQVVFAKIFHKLGQFSGKVPLEHWVSRVTINTCIKQLKYESIRPEVRMSDLSEEAERVVQDLISTDEEVPGDSWRQAREVVDELLRMLKPAERLVIRLLHLEERSTEEVSRMTGWSVALVKVRAFRARQKMRKAWGVLEARQAA